MTPTSDTPAMKRCPGCETEKPATTAYFHRKKTGKYGLASWCKKCTAKRERQYRLDNPEKVAGKKRQYHQANREKIAERDRQYRLDNREKIAGKKRQYREANREKIAEQELRYQQANREKLAEYARQYREANAETIAERQRQYREANREKMRVNSSRRRARKRGLPDTFTSEQWLQCLEYHNYCCPVCGDQLRDLFGDVEPHADHWIPINYEGDDNPGTVATNMICLCNTCNLLKQDTMPAIWLGRKYGKRKAKPIIARIEAYFDWVREREGYKSA